MKSMIPLFIILSSFSICISMGKRGPHHPRSEVSKSKKIDQHLSPHEENHIEEDLKDWGINLNEEDMTEEEKDFYYFKIHDNDENNALDGLELLNAALHQSKYGTLDDIENFENRTIELNHIIDDIDYFISIADTNNDGYLHYPEYMQAIINDRNKKTDEQLSINE